MHEWESGNGHKKMGEVCMVCANLILRRLRVFFSLNRYREPKRNGCIAYQQSYDAIEESMCIIVKGVQSTGDETAG